MTLDPNVIHDMIVSGAKPPYTLDQADADAWRAIVDARAELIQEWKWEDDQ
jgi:hypothetical protein